MSSPASSSTGMKCHYEILGVDRKATLEEIQKARKALSLKLHPDRNHGNEDEAREQFVLVQAAYEVLSNPDERAWYDSHREKILRGGNPHAAGGGVGGDSDDEGDGPEFLNLWTFFGRKAYTKMEDDGPKGFFGVFARVFKTVTDEDADFDPKAKEYPLFGDAKSDWAEVNRFYNFWQCYSTKKSFAWKDEYRAHDMVDRFQRRAAERINSTAREAGKREYSKLVQRLVDHVQRLDPRVEQEQGRMNAERQKRTDERERRENEVLLKRAEQRRKWQEEAEAEEAERRGGRTIAEDLEVLEQLYAMQDAAGGGKKKGGKNRSGTGNFNVQPGSVVPDDSRGQNNNDDDDDGDAKFSFRCEHCKKTVNSDKLWKEHCNSTKHKAMLRKLGIPMNKDGTVASAGAEGDDASDEASEPASPSTAESPVAALPAALALAPAPAAPVAATEAAAPAPKGKKQAPATSAQGKKQQSSGKQQQPPPQQLKADDDDDVTVETAAQFNTRKKKRASGNKDSNADKPLPVPKRNKNGQAALQPTKGGSDESSSDDSDSSSEEVPTAKSGKFGRFRK